MTSWEEDRISNDKLNSFWYQGEMIATYETEKRFLICEAAGAIEVYLPVDNGPDPLEALYKGIDAIIQADELGYDDEDIELLLSEDKFRLNNWFSFRYEEGEVSTEFDEVAGDYDEALEMMQEYIDEFPTEEEYTT